jgi:hypothetical protein
MLLEFIAAEDFDDSSIQPNFLINGMYAGILQLLARKHFVISLNVDITKFYPKKRTENRVGELGEVIEDKAQHGFYWILSFGGQQTVQAV